LAELTWFQMVRDGFEMLALGGTPTYAFVAWIRALLGFRE
jgi:hypothetical protein